jgi:hypothetical protein
MDGNRYLNYGHNKTRAILPSIKAMDDVIASVSSIQRFDTRERERNHRIP